MIATPQQHPPFHRPDDSRWQHLSPDEKLQEFRALATSPYWHLLPTEIKSRVQQLVASSTPSSS